MRFVATNGGKQMHEMVIGTNDALRKHAEQMRKSPAMKHDDAGAVHVAPGRSGDIVWTFDKPRRFAFACLVPGHLEAGMVGTIDVK